MSRGVAIDLGLSVLDHQLLDSEGRRCGKVDDLELGLLGTDEPRVVAILAGPSAWRDRGRLGRLAARLVRGRLVRVPWEEVADVKAGIALRKTANELRLGRGDDRARPWVEKLPGSSLWGSPNCWASTSTPSRAPTSAESMTFVQS
jgi:sporulation protein YlmC with PRC-barrel domain